MSGTANGTRKVLGTAALAGGALTATVTGRRTVVAAAAGAFGGLTGTATSPSLINGTGSAELGGLTASAQGSVPAAVAQGSWGQLVSIYAEMREIIRAETTQPPVACPYDGEPLSTAPDGTLFCLLGNYDYPRQRRII